MKRFLMIALMLCIWPVVGQTQDTAVVIEEPQVSTKAFALFGARYIPTSSGDDFGVVVGTVKPLSERFSLAAWAGAGEGAESITFEALVTQELQLSPAFKIVFGPFFGVEGSWQPPEPTVTTETSEEETVVTTTVGDDLNYWAGAAGFFVAVAPHPDFQFWLAWKRAQEFQASGLENKDEIGFGLLYR